MQRLIAGDILSFTMDKRYVRPNGSLNWVNLTVLPSWKPGQKPEYHLAVIKDITARKQLEEQLRKREQDLQAALDQRERIGQDLHDGILQSLFAIGLCLEASKPLIHTHRKTDSAKLGEVIDQSIHQLNRMMTDVRNFISGLDPHVLQGNDFASDLRAIAQTMSSSKRILCRVYVDRSSLPWILTEHALNILNIVREALSNTLRHSKSTKVTVSIKKLAQSIRLTITDNGVGFNPARVQESGHGLTNMTARARKIGGQLAITSQPRRGTKIQLDLPVGALYARN